MILVTGATGLLGSHLLVKLTQEGSSVTAMFRSERKREQVKSIFEYYFKESSSAYYSKIHWVKGDILDIPFLDSLVQNDMQIYHCAALVSFHRRDFHRLQKINREGTANIVNVALDKSNVRICHVSSTAALGSIEKEITEKSAWKKTPFTTGYSISKYNSEKEIWRGIEEGLSAVIVNPCVILGAGNWNDSSLAIFKNLEKGSRYYPTGSNATVDARDVATIMYRLMNANIVSEKYLCIGSNQSFKHLMSEICIQLNVKQPSKSISKGWVTFGRVILSVLNFFMGKRASLTKESVNSLYGEKSYANEKIKKELDYTFYSLEESIQNAIAGRIN